MTTLELLHWNDVHGRFDGLARLAARARTIRAESPHPVLVLDGGDVEDSEVRLSGLTYGVAGWRLLGSAGVDAAVAGNGGLLRYGPGLLPRYAEALGAPPLVCDLEDADGQTPAGAAPSVLLEAGDLRVGVVGATDYYPHYEFFGLRERGRVTAVRREADRLRGLGADVVVLLSHAGINSDRALSWALRSKVDVVVGGHTHDLLAEGDRTQGVPIAQAGCFAEHLGRIRLEVDDAGVRVTSMGVEPVEAAAPADDRVLAELAAAERDLDAWLAEPVGHLVEAAPHDPQGSCSVSRLMAEALLERRPGDLALLIAAHCEQGLPAGTVTRGDVWAATSSPGNPATATLTGAQVRAMIERGLSEDYATTTPRTFRGRANGRLQLAGVIVEGDRVLVGVSELRDEKRYRVTATDLELSTYGGLLPDDAADLEVHTDAILPEVLEAYLSSR
ncbi:MAG: bifunctional metallophosphatase/5'-nucleotidase [Nocardioides sp.]